MLTDNALPPEIAFYDDRAESFAAATVDADRSAIYARFGKYLSPGAHLLDLGCGSGRDGKYWQDQGCVVTALDGSPRLSKLAGELLGKPALCMRFDEIDFTAEFDAVWAFSSLLHISFAELPGILRLLHKAVKPGGYCYFSFMYGDFDGVRSERHFTDMNEEKAAELLGLAGGFELLETFITTDERPERKIDKKWLNMIVRRI